MGIRLIAMDLDGTALLSHRHVSPRMHRVIRRASEKGIYVVPATGRALFDIAPELLSVPECIWFLTSNGAAVINRATGEILNKASIPWERAASILRLLEKYELQPSIHIDGENINRQWADPRIRKRYGEENQGAVRYEPDLRIYVEEGKRDTDKIFAVLLDPADRERIREEVAAQDYGSRIVVAASSPDNIELTDLKATKGNGLRALAKKLGIRKEEIAVLGDSYNDLSMFREAGLRIAMGNAEAALKAEADLIAADCEADGAALAIEEILTEEENASGR